MHHSAHKKFHSDYDLHKDLEKIKAALFLTASDMKGRAGEMFANGFENVKDKTNELQHDAADFIAEKPFKTLIGTLLAGMVIGYLLHK